MHGFRLENAKTKRQVNRPAFSKNNIHSLFNIGTDNRGNLHHIYRFAFL